MERWELPNGTLEFDEDTHTYYFNGKKCISVTQLIKFAYPSKYEGIDKEVLKRASIRGTFLHETVEMYEKYGIETNEEEEFRNYLLLKNMYKFNVIQNEIPIVIQYKTLTICGRLDLVLEEDSILGLGDLKFTAELDINYLTLQLNLYRIGYFQTYKKSTNFLRGIHLKKSRRQYVEIPICKDKAYNLMDAYIEYNEKMEEKNE